VGSFPAALAFGFIASIVYLVIIGFIVHLVLRFVRAHERIAESIERISDRW
jgi:hypothetical protein